MNEGIAVKQAPELQSQRLYFRDITEADTDIVVKWRSNPEVYQYFVSPHRITEEEHLNWFRTNYIYDENRFDWIAINEAEQPVGVFGVKRTKDRKREAEVSYILDPEYYGKGYAAEAVNCLMLFCKQKWQCNTVIADIHKDNQRSIWFIQKLGFTERHRNGAFICYARCI